jgi:transcriptional regulator with XRE-family HTH domain
MDQKTDYRPLIEAAVTLQRWTRYKLAQQLGYKNVSGIYRVEAGKSGLSADKLTKLLKLAGKLTITAIGFFLAIGVAPIEKAYAEKTISAAPQPSVLLIMRIFE